MAGSDRSDRVHLGFLRVVHVEDAGFVGGLLVTNRQGRPLEFQCTTPVRPNRTQEILYGPTLTPFVHGELIGKTLVERLSVTPDVILVQQDSLLELREHVTMPVGLVLVEGTTPSEDLPEESRTKIGAQLVRFHPRFPEDAQAVEDLTRSVPGDADLAEPLTRIREALQETLRAGAVA